MPIELMLISVLFFSYKVYKRNNNLKLALEGSE